MDEFHLRIDPSVTEYNSTILDTSKQNFTGQACYNGSEGHQICCDVTTKITTTPSATQKNSYTYHLVAYSGVRSFDGFYNGGVEVCGIIACLNASLSSCGQRFPNYDDVEWPITFDQITIKATFENDENKMQYPNTLLSSIRPIHAKQIGWEATEVQIDGKNFTERTLSLIEPQDRLLTFAIYGRNFASDSLLPDDDDDDEDENSSASHWNRINLTVVVMEYHPIFRIGLTKEDRILANAEEHVRNIKAVKPLDLIVFPEYGLTVDPETAVELENFDNPCNNEGTYPTFIRDISCAARNASTYVVFNLVRKVKCGRNTLSKNCRRYGHFFYNTNVVLNRDGQIIYLYHKYNLFGEKNIDRPLTPQTTGLVTDFGLTLGIFSGFDILCKSPAQDLLANKEINTIVSPSKWYSELPFLTSLQTQRMWSYAHDIPLIAAGVNNPSTGNGGTGIYLGKGCQVHFSISPWGSTQMFSYGQTIAGLRQIYPNTDSRAKNMDEFNLSVDFSVIEYNSTILDISKQNFTGQVCYNGSEGNQICCDFTTKITTTPSATQKKSYTYHLYPNTLLSSIRPLYVKQIGWEATEVEINGKNFTERTLSLIEPQDRLLTFAIYGRNFAQDSLVSDDDDGNSSASHWDRINLTVAVVEYHPIFRSGLTKEGRILANAEEHVRKIKAIKPLDLIVFPEYGLTIDPETAIELENFDNPCNNEGTYPTFIRDISCAARNASTYVVFNLVRKVKCGRNTLSKNCRRYGHFFYNTNVVLNRSGQIIYLYHKYNLFGEKNIDRPLTPQTSGLVTDFGLTLGILSGFDILCKNPAQDLLAYKEINAIVSPSKWYSELPFLTSLQTQRMWSYAHDIPLIAAGVNDPSTGNGGTGIYLDYNSIVLDTSRQNFTGQVCYNSSEENQICCDFTTKITTTPSDIKKNSYTYHLVAYSGVRSFDGFYNGGVEVCGIIACLNASLSSCGQRFPNYDDIEWPITFDQITIKAAFENDENKAQYPNSLLSSIQPIIENQMVWDAKEVKIDGKNCIERTLSLNNPQDRVLTFAIYGRNFARDAIVPDNDDNVDDDNNNIDGDDDDDEDDDNNS
ncbi:CN hydrolase domain containing protein, partial [Asbolus verrucosus]